MYINKYYLDQIRMHKIGDIALLLTSEISPSSHFLESFDLLAKEQLQRIRSSTFTNTFSEQQLKSSAYEALISCSKFRYSIQMINFEVDGFLGEMRENAYLLEGAQRNAYAVDCCSLVDDWHKALSSINAFCEANYEISLNINEIEFPEFYIEVANISTTLFESKIFDIVDAFEKYFPETKTAFSEQNTAKDAVSSSLDQTPESTVLGAKLQWNCKPAVAGFIISELIRGGYLEPAITNGEYSPKKMAKICNQHFLFRDYSPGIDSWLNVIDPGRNTLSTTKRTKLKLPDLDLLA